MSGMYDDIIDLPHHVSVKRKQMPVADRAAQFSPFAALTGYEAAIQEMGRVTAVAVELDVDEKNILDHKLQVLNDLQTEQPEVRIVYFVPDIKKNGGAYLTVTGNVRKVDPLDQCILLRDGTIVDFGRIRKLQGEIFQQYEGLYFWE